MSFQTFQPLILIYRRNNFVYHLWGCTLIYQPLSYPFGSMHALGESQRFVKVCVLISINANLQYKISKYLYWRTWEYQPPTSKSEFTWVTKNRFTTFLIFYESDFIVWSRYDSQEFVCSQEKMKKVSSYHISLVFHHLCKFSCMQSI